MSHTKHLFVFICSALATCTFANNSFAKTAYDYNGDNRADVAVRRISNLTWYIQNSNGDNFNSTNQDGIQRVSFGLQNTDIPVVGDFDGDGITDIAVRRPSTFYWYVLNSGNNNYNSSQNDGIQRVTFGKQATDIPVPADYDGDGITDFAVRRPSNFYWYIKNSGGSNFNSEREDGIQRIQFGINADDIPVKGDFDGDGKDDIAVRRPSNYFWYVKNSSGSNYNSEKQDGIQRIQFGLQSGDIPVPADYDGDGYTDIAVRRPSTFYWYILNSSGVDLITNNQDGITRIVFGQDENDIPVPADYDGDGKADIAVRRDSNQFFYILNSSNSETQRINFGKQENDIPINAPISEIITKLNRINTPSTENSAPVANAGNDITASVLETVNLDGSGSSDADGDTLTYLWSLANRPENSSASIQAATEAMASLTPDVAGSYVVSLTVNDGSKDSQPDELIISVSEQTAVSPDFYTPAPIIDALTQNRVISWQQLETQPSDLMRFSFGQQGTDNLFVINDEEHIIEDTIGIVDSLASNSNVSDELLLRSMFKFIREDDNQYRIVSTKHSNYVLDLEADSNKIILRDYRSGNKNESLAGYLVFEINQSSPFALNAIARKKFDANTNTYVEDGQFSAGGIALANDELILGTETTELTFYQPPIDFDIPFDLNPDQIERVSNPEVTPVVKGSDLTGIPSMVVDKYAAQLSAEGDNANTESAAQAILDQIETDLTAAGEQLRYPKAFYMAFRKGLLSRVYESSDSTDGTLGQYTVPYVYFTNEADDNGNLHPFMIIASYGLPDSLTLLWDVPRPPGDGLAGNYNDEAVTRSIHLETNLIKIPLRDYGEVESLTENEMNSDLASDVGETNLDHHNYASVSATGVAIDGVVIYPSYNNRLHVAQADAELSAHGMHSGRGLGAHYHADAHSAKSEGLNLYNTSDYVGHVHPPIISMGFDGVAGYGVYQPGDSTSDGVDVALDDFGGHEHGNYGYHYHSFTVDAVTAQGNGPNPGGGTEYTAHQLPPLGAWSGRINDIPEFWDDRSPDYVGKNPSRYLGTKEN